MAVDFNVTPYNLVPWTSVFRRISSILSVQHRAPDARF